MLVFSEKSILDIALDSGFYRYFQSNVYAYDKIKSIIATIQKEQNQIITTNMEFSKWNGIFYDDQLTAALIDRLVHHSHLIVFERDSWRF